MPSADAMYGLRGRLKHHGEVQAAVNQELRRPGGDFDFPVVGAGESEQRQACIDLLAVQHHVRDNPDDGIADAITCIEELEVVALLNLLFTGELQAFDEIEAMPAQ